MPTVSDRPPIRLTVDLAASDAANALDVLRRVRLFADECRQAGLLVVVDGSLSIIVRPQGRRLPDSEAQG